MELNERLNVIINILKRKKHISIKELQKLTYESESTLRRDLIKLESDNKIIRSSGRVELAKNNITEFGYDIRKSNQCDQKKYISEIANDFIGNGQALFIDSSTTASYLDRYIKEKKQIVVVTNGIHIASSLNLSKNVRTFLPGGFLKHSSGSIVGSTSEAFFKEFKADIAFVSCEAIDINGIYMASDNQSSVKKQMLKNAEQNILLVDSSKFMMKNFYVLSDFSNINVVITDKKPPQAIIERLEDMNIELLY
ncbi:DeoR family transcriptional regulator [Companilactobacillus sp. RD055328]|uniref:DeoR/GlpR family DNA-binding transcription regulator n=1 Tax=Companilactobacillus sp. RD055328 TaxID=2916634 RepID=UPI001FC8D4AE|nr:DeoR/GlpR family DNA-binding transcription regulator [Companilactobacillus sp. RD055328]GKQ43453.1 DeoR family transcriptional regulator [Companilactobacillus sp. RD055328]